MTNRVDSFFLRLAAADELHTLAEIDDQASELYSEAGITLALEKDHPFVVGESVRWADAIERGLAHVAVDAHDRPVGFITLRFVDGEPDLDQLAVRPSHMRRGIGTALLRYAISWRADRPLWLTTYSHLAWNRPYYERHGFVVVPENVCGPELCSILEEQRAVLPHPANRIAMVRHVSQ